MFCGVVAQVCAQGILNPTRFLMLTGFQSFDQGYLKKKKKRFNLELLVTQCKVVYNFEFNGLSDCKEMQSRTVNVFKAVSKEFILRFSVYIY